MKNKITIVIVALMVAALAAPAVMAADVSYSASVVTSSVTVITNDAAFGDLLAGTSNRITDSLTLTNSGGAVADVDAKFTTNASSTYGLVSGAEVIGGSNFQIGTNGNEVALSNSNTDTPLGTSNQLPAGGFVKYDAILDVPSGQAPGVYSGNVQLTFTAVM